MKRLLTLAAALTALLILAGCTAQGTPKVVTPVTSHNFGDVPVSSNRQDIRTKEFLIQNQGTGDLKLSNVQVKILEGC